MGRDISTPQRTGMTVERWHRMLNDATHRRDLPDSYRNSLVSAAGDLLRAGIIDPLEHFDLVELANAAYSHEIEEQIVLHRYFRVSGYYDVGRGENRIGVMRSTRFYLESDPFRTPAGFYAIAERTERGLELTTNSTRQAFGLIDGKRFIAATGESYELVETMRRVDGIEWPTIDEPDIYRNLLDAIQLAAEAGDHAKRVALTQRAGVSIFMPCPACGDSFVRREDCAECRGDGFVPETPERFRWRS